MPGLTWWPGQEELSDKDVERLENAPLDVLVTHDAPAGMEPTSEIPLRPETEERSRFTRVRVLRALQSTHPQLVLHGHWHVRHRMDVNHDGHAYRIEGLADDEAGAASWGVLDLATLAFKDGTEIGT